MLAFDGIMLHAFIRLCLVWGERRDELCWIKRIETLQVDGDGVKDRPRKRWREVLRGDMREKGLCREDAWERSR